MGDINEFKIINALNKLLDPGISQSISETHLNYLLRYLTGKEEDLGAIGCPRIGETLFLPWIKQVVDQWRNNELYISKNIVTFVAELTAAMCVNEQIFVKLNFTKILGEFLDFLRSLSDPSSTAQIKLSYIELISSFLNHKSGIQWIMVTNYWFDVFTMISPQTPKELSDKSCKFIVKLLEISRIDNQIFCCNIIDMITSPLKDLAAFYNKSATAENEDLILALYPLNKIVENILLSNCEKGSDSALRYFRDRFDLENNLKDLLVIVKNPDINFELLKIFYLPLMFPTAEYFVRGSDNRRVDPNEHEQLGIKTVDILVKAMYHLEVRKGMELIYRIHELFQTVVRSIRDQKKAKETTMICHIQLILFIIYPVQNFAMGLVGKSANELDEIRDQLTTKILQRLTPVTIRAYMNLTSLSMRFTIDDATVAIKYLVLCSKFYSQYEAIIAIRIMIYVLVDIFNVIKTKPEIIPTLSQDFFVTLLDTIMLFLTSFKIEWKDSIEATYLTEITSKFLDIYPWSPMVVVKAFQLLDVGISKSLSPNMALLIDIADSDVDFGRIIYDKLCDANWKIKNVAVQVVRTICLKVQQKFDTYRKIVIDADFPSTILKISRTDREISVKISAIRCLQEMVKINDFWNKLLENINLYEQLLQMYLEPQAEVRSEVVILLKEMYVRHQLSEPVLVTLYNNMLSAVLQDPHVPVKINGLEFWHQVIERHLSNEGMIDGAFPSMTFSKSLKKIIKFNEREIKICLTRVVDQLTETGCLQAFHFALHYEYDDQLRAAALKLLRKFMDLLKKYMPTSDHVPTNHTSELDPDLFTIDQLIKHSLMDSLIMDMSPYLDDFCENLLDIGEPSSNPSSVYSNCNSEVDNFNKNEFLKLASDFESLKYNDIKQKEQLKGDFDTIINYILDL